MDIKRLNHMLALAEEGRFALAASRVHLSQAAFSRSIQTLESQLGLRLFDRGAEGARLTPAGAQVLERARALLFESRCLQGDIELIKSGDAGEISIGAAPVPAYLIVPELLSRLRKQNPGLMVRVRTGNLPTLLEQVDAQHIDICLGDPRLVEPHARHARTALGRLAGGLYCRSGHPVARKGHIDAAALRRYGIAMISIPPDLNALLARELGFGGIGHLPQAVECDDIHTLVQLVVHSDVIGLLPHAAALPLGRRVRLLWQDAAPDMVADVHAIWLKGRTLAPAALRAIELAREVGAGLAGM